MTMGGTDMAQTGAPERFSIGPVLWISLAFIFVISLPNLIDPMIRHDDFPALLGYGDAFYHKTLHEGRWINYIWHLREIITPSWLNFAVYQICWAIFAASIAVLAAPGQRITLMSVLLAALVLLTPPATLISLWFNTLQLGIAIIAIYAVIVCKCSERTSRMLLPVFTVPALMAYTTYPLLLLALCLMRTRNRSVRDLFWLMVLFGASFVGAILITYALNWYFHGIFGIPLAEWRQAVPAGSFSEMWGNLGAAQETFILFFGKSSFASNSVFFAHVIALVLATVVLAQRAPLEVLYLYAGLLTGIALITLQAVKLGIVVPARALIFFWIFYAVIVVRGIQVLNDRGASAARLGVAAIVVVLFSYGAQAHKRYTLYHEWQGQTRQSAEDLAALPAPYYVLGRAVHSEAGMSASIQSNFALFFRITQLTGQEPLLCDSEGVDCSNLDRAAALAQATSDWHVGQIDGKTVLVIREVDDPGEVGLNGATTGAWTPNG